MKFILAVIGGELVVSNRKRKDIEADLEAMDFDRMTKAEAASKRSVAPVAEAEVDGDDAGAEAADGKSFDYLLAMAISSLTFEKVRLARGW